MQQEPRWSLCTDPRMGFVRLAFRRFRMKQIWHLNQPSGYLNTAQDAEWSYRIARSINLGKSFPLYFKCLLAQRKATQNFSTEVSIASCHYILLAKWLAKLSGSSKWRSGVPDVPGCCDIDLMTWISLQNSTVGHVSLEIAGQETCNCSSQSTAFSCKCSGSFLLQALDDPQQSCHTKSRTVAMKSLESFSVVGSCGQAVKTQWSLLPYSDKPYINPFKLWILALRVSANSVVILTFVRWKIRTCSECVNCHVAFASKATYGHDFRPW